MSASPETRSSGRSHRHRVLIEDDIAPAAAAVTRPPAKTRTLVTEDLKYTRHSTGEEQLFDLTTDPDEMHDISGIDPNRRATAMELLTDALIAADDDARGGP